jgi:prenyltransferase beta subunit
MRQVLYILWGCLTFLTIVPAVASAATKEQIQASIDRGVAFLRQGYSKAPEGHRGLIGLTLLKAGLPASTPEIRDAIALARKKCSEGGYKGHGEHYYEAGVDATLLADSGEECKAELEIIAKYIVDGQNPNGGWTYPGEGESVSGDTSLIQYCALGLWAADRMGVEIDPQVWVKMIEWHARYQGGDGGFAYRPGTMGGDGMGQATLNMTVNSIGSIHIAMLHLDNNSVPFMDRAAPARQSAASAAPASVLEVVEIDKEKTNATAAKVGVPAVAKPTIMKAYGWLSSRFRVSNEPAINRMYYYYSLERMGALADIQKIGSHDWYNECADYVIKIQKPDGSWKESNYITLTAEIDTAFAVLFLTRSTGKLLKRTEPKYGDGLLAGGRGLPDDLSEATFNGRTVEEKKKPVGPLDELLASLEKTGDIDISEMQEQIVEKIQVGNREDLIKQKDLLVRLASHPDPANRQMAMWALGRTDDMRLAMHLIRGLDDVDLGVMVEAQTALCWLARRPRGFGLPEDPTDALPPDATAEAKRAAIVGWHRAALTQWGRWYLESRPYEDRGDEFEAWLRLRLEELRKQL